MSGEGSVLPENNTRISPSPFFFSAVPKSFLAQAHQILKNNTAPSQLLNDLEPLNRFHACAALALGSAVVLVQFGLIIYHSKIV